MTFLLKLIITLILDTAILVALALIFGPKQQQKYPRVLGSSAAVAGCFALYGLVPRWLLGYLFVLPLLVFTGAILMIFGRLRLKQAAIATGIFFLLHVLIGWAV